MFIASSAEVAEPNADVMLELELELMELLEFEPPREDPEVEGVAPLPLSDRLEGAAAIGADTLAVWEGTGSAIVTPAFICSLLTTPPARPSNWGPEIPDPLCFAVAGEMRTERHS